MKTARLTEGQIIRILQELEAGVNCADLCCSTGCRRGRFHAWKAKSSEMTVSGAKRLRALEGEIAKLMKLSAERMLDMAAMKELLAERVA